MAELGGDGAGGAGELSLVVVVGAVLFHYGGAEIERVKGGEGMKAEDKITLPASSVWRCCLSRRLSPAEEEFTGKYDSFLYECKKEMACRMVDGLLGSGAIRFERKDDILKCELTVVMGGLPGAKKEVVS